VSDLEIATKHLIRHGLSIVIVKKGKIIAEDKGKGISPLLGIIDKLGDELSNASLADKVLGKAAVALSLDVGIKRLYGNIVSENAIDYVNTYGDKNIRIEAETVVPFIKNQNQTDMCPVEKLALKLDNINVIKFELRNFLDDKEKCLT